MRDDSGFPTDRPIDRLKAVMARLRDPAGGCPWDLAQDFRSIAPYTIEEAYEVADAIERADLDALRDELGDLLLQVVFHARMAEEQQAFDFDDVAQAIIDKLLRRHPHVFGDAAAADAHTVRQSWDGIKAAERAAKAETGVLDGIPGNLPALTRGEKLQRRAARVGFDWKEPEPILAKIREEICEFEHEMQSRDRARLTDELGDILFAVVNLARHLEIDPEAALRGTNRKFETRFRFIERALAQAGRTPEDATLDEMEDLWQQAKSVP